MLQRVGTTLTYNLLVIGPVQVDRPDYHSTALEQRLRQLRPSCLISDFSPGWGELAIKAALATGVPIMGAVPFPTPIIATYRRRVRSIFIAADSVGEFLGNPETQLGYYRWLGEYTNTAIVHGTEKSPHMERILETLRQTGAEVHSI